MEQKLIGRQREQELIRKCLKSGRAEFVAIYGRRRVGKTYLLRRFFNDKFDFYITGQYDVKMPLQLRNFHEQLIAHSKHYVSEPKNWHEAFNLLKAYIQELNKKEVVLFFDELPWLDTKNSNFVRELDYFWNSWASMQDNIKLFVCGSATTWMMNKLIGDKGGLHNRLTHSIHLSPFTLKETEDYLQFVGIDWDRYTIVQCYMIFGGIPYYLSLLDNGKRLDENVDSLLFNKDGALRREFDFVYRALFKDSQLYYRVIETLGKKKRGLSREELRNELNLEMGGKLSTVLQNLEKCDFVRCHASFNKKTRGAMYQLVDLYTLFYLQFIAKNSFNDENAWSNMIDNSARTAWCGYAFEQVCLHHSSQIKKALGISGVLTNICSWSGSDGEKRGQIDLVIDRNDHTINLCEMKYAIGEYEIDKSYSEKLINRRELFRNVTKTKKSLRLTMVTTYGIKPGKHNNVIQDQLTMDQIFE